MAARREAHPQGAATTYAPGRTLAARVLHLDPHSAWCARRGSSALEVRAQGAAIDLARVLLQRDGGSECRGGPALGVGPGATDTKTRSLPKAAQAEEARGDWAAGVDERRRCRCLRRRDDALERRGDSSRGPDRRARHGSRARNTLRPRRLGRLYVEVTIHTLKIDPWFVNRAKQSRDGRLNAYDTLDARQDRRSSSLTCRIIFVADGMPGCAPRGADNRAQH